MFPRHSASFVRISSGFCPQARIISLSWSILFACVLGLIASLLVLLGEDGFFFCILLGVLFLFLVCEFVIYFGGCELKREFRQVCCCRVVCVEPVHLGVAYGSGLFDEV